MNESGSSRSAALSVVAGALALSACGGQGRTGHGPQAEAGAYLPPPTVTSADRAPDGAVRLSGQAPPNALVRLRAPAGGAATAQADDRGRWRTDLPASATPRLYALQAELPARVVRGEGALAVMPAPGTPALTLRAGFAASAAGQGRPGQLQLVSLDFDGGGAAVGGFAPPGSPVRLKVDDELAGVTRADAQGRFAVLSTVRNVSPGPHRIRVETPQGLSLEAPVQLAQPALAADQPFAASAAPGGWLIRWQLPGGGVQSSRVFDRAVVDVPASPARGAAR